MLMLAIDLGRIRVGLVIGPAADTDASLRRLVQIEAASGAGCSITIFAPAPDLRLAGRAGDRLTRRLPTGDDLAGMGILFVSGLDEVSATAVADAARAAGALVNVEDRTGLCDFHMPALVQRGDLQIAIATGGRSPGLARGIRRYLEELFPSDW